VARDHHESFRFDVSARHEVMVVDAPVIDQ
jgi:hypothetical protein